MKIIITENIRNRVITKWLDNNYNDLIGMENSHGTIDYKKKDGKTMFSFHTTYSDVTIEDNELQSYLFNMFNLKRYDLNQIVKPWIEETYGIDVDLVQYTTWHCNKCGKYHPTKYHIEE